MVGEPGRKGRAPVSGEHASRAMGIRSRRDRRLQPGRGRPGRRPDPRLRPAGEAGREHGPGGRRVRLDHRRRRRAPWAAGRAGRRDRRRRGGQRSCSAELATAGVDTAAMPVRPRPADRHDRRAVAGRRPGHPHRRGRHRHADPGRRARRTARPGPARPRQLLLPARAVTSVPACPRCSPPPARPAPPPRSTPTGTRPGSGGRSFFPEVLAQADLLLPNEAEALKMAGTTDLRPRSRS